MLGQYWANIGELGPMPCNKLFAYWWWKVFLEFGVLIAVIVILALSKDYHLLSCCLPCIPFLSGDAGLSCRPWVAKVPGVANALQP